MRLFRRKNDNPVVAEDALLMKSENEEVNQMPEQSNSNLSVEGLRDLVVALDLEIQRTRAAIMRTDQEAKAAFDRQDGTAVDAAFKLKNDLEAKLAAVTQQREDTYQTMLSSIQPELDAWADDATRVVTTWHEQHRETLAKIQNTLSDLAQTAGQLETAPNRHLREQRQLEERLAAIVARTHPFGPRIPNAGFDRPRVNAAPILETLVNLQRRIDQLAR